MPLPLSWRDRDSCDDGGGVLPCLCVVGEVMPVTLSVRPFALEILVSKTRLEDEKNVDVTATRVDDELAVFRAGWMAPQSTPKRRGGNPARYYWRQCELEPRPKLLPDAAMVDVGSQSSYPL